MRLKVALSLLHLVGLSAALLLSGCGVGPETPSEGAVVVSGIVHGGQQPVVGAHVYLMAAAVSGTVAANNGYGNASISMLTGTGYSDSIGGYVPTDSRGYFAITGDFNSCAETGTSSSSQVYLYAVGGSAVNGQTNTAAGFLAALGTCGSLSSSTTIYMNEVTTVATAYALAGFATDATHISIPAYTTGTTPDTLAAKGLSNAFKTAPNLANFATGQALSAPASESAGIAPQMAVNTLANILAACINTSGGPGSTLAAACQTLMENATATGTSAGSPTATGDPTDTATAAINIAHHPYSNVATLFGLQVPQSPFLPSFAANAQPTDFTLCITFNGAGLGGNPYSASIDAAGDIWQNAGGNYFAVIANNGTPISTSSGFPFPVAAGGNGQGSAFDLSGNIWLTTYGQDGTYEFGTNGSPVNTAGFDKGGWYPFGMAADANGHMWTSFLHELNSTGTVISTSSAATNGFPVAIAIDGNGNIWSSAATSGSGSPALLGTTSTGAMLPNEPSTGVNTGCFPGSIAIDSANNIWIASQTTNVSPIVDAVCKLVYSNGTYTPTTYTMANYEESVAVDGAGNVFGAMYDSTNARTSSVSEMNNAGTLISPTKGFAYGVIQNFGGYTANNGGVIVDGSGNVWYNGSNELVGLGTPVVTPLVQGLIAPYTPGSRP